MQWRWTARTMHEDLGGGLLRVTTGHGPEQMVRLPAALRWVPEGLVRGVHVSDLSPASEVTETLRALMAQLATLSAVEPVTAPPVPAPHVWVYAPHPMAALLAGLLDLSGGCALPVGAADGQALVTAWTDTCDPDLVAIAAGRGLPVVGIALLDGAAVVSPALLPGSPCPRCLDLSLRVPAGPARIGRVGMGRTGALDLTLRDARAAAAALGRVQSALALARPRDTGRRAVPRCDGTPAEGQRPFLVRGHDGRDDVALAPLQPHPWCEACPPRVA